MIDFALEKPKINFLKKALAIRNQYVGTICPGNTKLRRSCWQRLGLIGEYKEGN